MLKVLRAIDQIIEKFSSVGLIVTVVLMLVLSVGAIFLRWVNVTFIWVDPFVRHAVFLSAFLGGVIATGRRTHIGIDIIGKYLENRGLFAIQKHLTKALSLFCLVMVAWLCKASYDFMMLEFQYGKPDFLGVHSGFLVGIIPFGLLLIAYRFFYIFISSFFNNKENEINRSE